MARDVLEEYRQKGVETITVPPVDPRMQANIFDLARPPRYRNLGWRIVGWHLRFAFLLYIPMILSGVFYPEYKLLFEDFWGALGQKWYYGLLPLLGGGLFLLQVYSLVQGLYRGFVLLPSLTRRLNYRLEGWEGLCRQPLLWRQHYSQKFEFHPNRSVLFTDPDDLLLVIHLRTADDLPVMQAFAGALVVLGDQLDAASERGKHDEKKTRRAIRYFTIVPGNPLVFTTRLNTSTDVYTRKMIRLMRFLHRDLQKLHRASDAILRVTVGTRPANPFFPNPTED